MSHTRIDAKLKILLNEQISLLPFTFATYAASSWNSLAEWGKITCPDLGKIVHKCIVFNLFSTQEVGGGGIPTEAINQCNGEEKQEVW